jgi:anthranilate phosphoribosyltransferase
MDSAPRSAGGTQLVRDAIATTAAGADLDAATMQTVVDVVMAGDATPAQIGSLLTALRIKGETVDELTGAARALRARMLRVPWGGLVVDT